MKRKDGLEEDRATVHDRAAVRDGDAKTSDQSITQRKGEEDREEGRLPEATATPSS
ncbi:uncharacterized protein DS421_13g424100 [Arachis hypogaea]|nr:uncharacterized protein DS421_13g424100 [Arachis hypogaea]